MSTSRYTMPTYFNTDLKPQHNNTNFINTVYDYAKYKQ